MTSSEVFDANTKRMDWNKRLILRAVRDISISQQLNNQNGLMKTANPISISFWEKKNAFSHCLFSWTRSFVTVILPSLHCHYFFSWKGYCNWDLIWNVKTSARTSDIPEIIESSYCFFVITSCLRIVSWFVFFFTSNTKVKKANI